jgi:outer membrane protein
MIKQLLSVFLFFSIAIASVAQSQSGKKIYTLKECIEIALQNNLTVKRSELGLKNADITLDQSRYTMLPTLNLSGSGGLNFGRSVDPPT